MSKTARNVLGHLLVVSFLLFPAMAEAAIKLGLAPPNYHRICKELGLK